MPEWLRQRAHLTPDRLALVTPTDRLTFAELDRRIDTTAAALAGLTQGRPGRVALLLRNGTPFVLLVHAAARVGIELVLLNTRLTTAELGFQIDDAGVAVLLHDAADADLARAAASDRPIRLADVAELPSAPASIQAMRQIDLEAVQSVIYTSGTTGQPKGAALTFGNHWWSAVGSALNLGLREDDRWLACLPLFHVGGLSILWRSAIYGIGAVVHESFDERAVNAAIDAERVTIVSVVAAMLQRMLDARGSEPYPPWLRCVLLGGGPAPRPLLEACAARGMPVVQTYGLTEAASQVATLAPEDALRKLGSAGKPLFPTELRVEGPAGEIGEIVVRGPTVTRGYVNRPDATERAIRHGWLHTGDVGRLDDDGYLYVVDRRDDLIISGGENVYPAEVEAALLAHPAVAEAGVAGLPDATWGQAVLAVVVPRPGSRIDLDDLRAHCRARLAGYKVPSTIRLADALPRNAAGKILRRRLPELAT